MREKLLSGSLGVVLAIGFLAPLAERASAQAGHVAQQLPLQKLEVDTASGAHVFAVQLARTDAERETGLMFRKTMPKDQGMLFDFPGGDRQLAFWMKDTLLPLDMIFIGSDGRVVSIARDAKPMDTSIISSGRPAKGVLEVNAGEADAIGLKVGDLVKHPMFGDTGRQEMGR